MADTKRASIDHDLEVNSPDPVQVVPVDVLGIGAAHDVDKDVGGDVLEVGEHERGPVAVLVLVGEVVEGDVADLGLAFAVWGQRVVDELAREVQVHLELAVAQDEHVVGVGAHLGLIRQQLGRQRVRGPVRLWLPAVDFVDLDDDARLGLVVLVVS
jgi:hypothetical protein